MSSRLNLALYRTLFGTLARWRPPRNKPLQLGASSRVLVFSTAGIGDSLMDSLALRALAETWPGIHLTVVAHHRRRQMALHNPLVREVLPFRKGPPAFVALWRRLQRTGPWAAIFHLRCHDPESRCLGYLLNRDANLSTPWLTEFSHLCSHNIPQPDFGNTHLAVQTLRLAEAAGAATLHPRMVYEVRREEDQAYLEAAARHGWPQNPSVVCQLGGGSGGSYRDWPVEHFVELAAGLQAAGAGPVLLLGGPDHRRQAEQFARSAGSRGLPFHDAAGRLPLELSAALLARARCLVSTDTGIMHLGFALGTPTVALIHCQHGIALVGPLADAERHALLELPKPPGYRHPADARMASIRPETVQSEVLRLLGSSVP